MNYSDDKPCEQETLVAVLDMTPFEKVRAHYASEGVEFQPVMEFCRRWGIVKDEGNLFLMAVPVNSLETWRQYRVRAVRPVDGKYGDAWLVLGMAGDMRAAWAYEHHAVDWILFERGKRLHMWPRNRIRSLTCKTGARSPTGVSAATRAGSFSSTPAPR